MKFVVDLHLHSKYSRAVSQAMTLPNMAHWAKLKGISVLATGDFTHPFWFDQLSKELEEAGNGLYRLKPTIDNLHLTSDKSNVPAKPGQMSNVYFLLSCEIASIYSQGGKSRRIHTLFFFPSLSSVEKFNNELRKRGANLRSDGRPIVGMSSRDLAQIALSCDDKALVIPAHIWTPWFSLYGSFSGFDSIEECFGDMAKYIYGIETGLSSDPGMNWMIGDLDNRSILSFSDAHSLEKMGREATVIEADEISYSSIYDAIRNGSKGTNGTKVSKIAFTIEFYPEEGKYHYSGHRDCNFSLNPQETKEKGKVCPVCGRPLTIGVLHRVEELKTKISNFQFQISNRVRWVRSENGRPPFVSLVPLNEILAEVVGTSVGTKKVQDAYQVLVNNLGSELSVLIKAKPDEIARFSNSRAAEGVTKVRTGDIYIEPGYDNKYGVVKIWQESGIDELSEMLPEGSVQSQLNLL